MKKLQIPLLVRQSVSSTLKYLYIRRTYMALLLCTVIFITWSSARFPKYTMWLEERRFLPERGAANIFFIETTCAIEDLPWMGLRPRQACAVESAVRHNPGRPIYVLHTCEAPTSDTWLPAGATAVHVVLAEFLRDTPLYGPLIENGNLAASRWPVHHASDVMRLVALWKYGGLYLDLDFVILRNLSKMGENWIAAESNYTLANGAMHMSSLPGSAGKELANTYMETLRTEFDGQQWTSNGGAILMKLLLQRCNVTKVMVMRNCRGFRVLGPALLYPVPFQIWRKYFSEEDTNSTLAAMHRAYAAHMWNKLSEEAGVVPQNSAYAKLARENCPNSFRVAAGHF
ncbi:lactosylceramide 4-alpha-galactosyltransferase-like isoform X1 [Schistocerca nitens]|uniref:lactosylceramide 4-alpha-galactosyltransferase-like isoform X1 n=2 Tax=Schistocerca nitens TaxID=7011 RepID=UPI00211773E8|nr:lactosylceramide 4-alpha-galactosyltransferase-like isoform X1 [Schistocerca nitens]XP_049803115.1 lactosylceramide 4-alpha-galactosyltransferase-like isoform X1 [Schistocerca nitens]